jgi:hypothetical protein
VKGEPATDRERYYAAIRRLDEISAPIEARMKLKCTWLLQLKPTASDWMTLEEAQEIHTCKLTIMELEHKLMGPPRERIAIKRKLRARGVEFDPRAPMEDLVAACLNSSSVVILY